MNQETLNRPTAEAEDTACCAIPVSEFATEADCQVHKGIEVCQVHESFVRNAFAVVQIEPPATRQGAESQHSFYGILLDKSATGR